MFHVSVNSGTVLMDANFVAKVTVTDNWHNAAAADAVSAARSEPEFRTMRFFLAAIGCRRGQPRREARRHRLLPRSLYPLPNSSPPPTGSRSAPAALTYLPAVPVHADRVEQRRAGLAFQYGVLVLELVTGQSPGADGELVRWAQDPGSAASVHRMVDADLGGVYDARELRDLVAVARLCTRDRDDRDEGAGVVTIPQIVRYLQGKLERIGCQARFG